MSITRLSLDPLIEAARQVVASRSTVDALREEDIAEAMGLALSTYFRYKRFGTIPWVAADEAAIRLGLHPIIVWRDEWLDLDRDWLQAH